MNEYTNVFIPFEDLTEAKAIEWVKAEWSSLEEVLKEELAELKTSTRTNRLPWLKEQ